MRYMAFLAVHLYIILLVCVLYVTLSMRISVHNKSPKLFTVKPESHSRRRVRHWALKRKVRDRYARRQFHSSLVFFFFFSFLFFTFGFRTPVFFPLSPPYPLPLALPTPEDFFPNPMHDCKVVTCVHGIGCYMVVTTLRQFKFIDKVVPTLTGL